ncbi:MAG: ribonuclease P protein component [Pseudomonadota bacterium]
MLERLKRRAEFKDAAKGVRVGRDAFTLQAVRRNDRFAPKVGFTVTKRVGNAVVRNRIKRRLRALCDCDGLPFEAGTNYVILARHAALRATHGELSAALRSAVEASADRLQRGMGKIS